MTDSAVVVPTLLWKKITISLLLSFLVLFTASSNLLVLLSFYFEKKLRNTFTLYIANLSVTDFLMGSISMVFYTVNTVLGYWPFGQFLCGVWIFFDSVVIGASILTLVTISVDR